MKSKREQILKLCEFPIEEYSNVPIIVRFNIKQENLRLQPIITALLDENEKLRAALEYYAGLNFSTEYFYKDSGEYCYNIVSKPEIETLARQALSTCTEIDELLEGE